MGAAEKLNPIILDERLLTEVVEGVRNVFKQGFGLDVQLKSHNIGKDHMAAGDISGVVGMSQDQFEGNLILSFPKPVLFFILSRVYGREFNGLEQVVKEGAAELANMVYGQIKNKLNSRGHDLKMSLPNVVIGQGHNIYSSSSCPTLVTVFGFEDKEFSLFITLQGC